VAYRLVEEAFRVVHLERHAPVADLERKARHPREQLVEVPDLRHKLDDVAARELVDVDADGRRIVG